MLLELQHFVYSLYPRKGYGITASSPGIDKREWKTLCEPSPVGLDDLEKLHKVWALQKIQNSAVISSFIFGAKDEYNRPGMFGHHIIIPAQIYFNVGASPISFRQYFVTDVETIGDLPVLSLNSDDLRMQPVLDPLSIISTNTLEQIVESMLTHEAFRLVCPKRSTEEMFSLVSAFIHLLPPSARMVPFITAPLSRSFRKAHGDDRFPITLVQEDSFSLLGTQGSIDIDKDYSSNRRAAPQSKTAHYIVSQFRQHGYGEVQRLHSKWVDSADLLSSSRNFSTVLDVEQGVISIKTVREVRKKGNRQEAKRNARAIVNAHRWGSHQDLAELFTVLLEDSVPQSAKPEITLLINETKDLDSPVKYDIYNSLIESLPKLGSEIVSELRDYYGNTFITGLGDLSKYPAILSLVLSTSQYGEFQSLSTQILKDTQADLHSFAGNLKYMMVKVRKQFGDMVLDYIQHLLANFPGYKDSILGQVQPGDFIPNSVMSHIPKELRQRLFNTSEKILQVLKLLQ